MGYGFIFKSSLFWRKNFSLFYFAKKGMSKDHDVLFGSQNSNVNRNEIRSHRMCGRYVESFDSFTFALPILKRNSA